MFHIGRNALFRDAGFGCLGSYRTIRIAFGPIYLCFGWRTERWRED